MKKRTVALLCAAVMLLGVVFGGTMALLSHSSTPLTNTFTTADIDLTLEEETGENYIMAPGAVLDKDPTVTVVDGSASCWLFVKVKELNNAPVEIGDEKVTPVTWVVDSGWTEITYKTEAEREALDLEEGEHVYWRTYIKESGQNQFPVLTSDEDHKGGMVAIDSRLTKDYMDSIQDGDKKPQLIFTAYAIQQDWLKTEEGKPINDPAQAWALAKEQTTPSAMTPEA